MTFSVELWTGAHNRPRTPSTPGREQIQQRVTRQRAGEQVALTRRTAQPGQGDALGRLLNTFGDDQQVQASPQLDGGPHHRGCFRRRAHGGHETAIDLQLDTRGPSRGMANDE